MAKNESGYTLVELIITILVFGLVAGSMVTLYTSIQQNQVRATHLETATRAAQHQIESLRNGNYNTLEPGSSIDFTDDLPDTLPQSRSGNVEVSEPLSGLRRVDVTVEYSYQGKPEVVELSSLIGAIGITQ